MIVSVDLNNLYFAPPTKHAAIGESIKLNASNGKLVKLSKAYGSWVEEDIIASVLDGTNVTIIERKSEPMGDEEFVRYRVRVEFNGRELDGWVHQSNVESE